MEIAIYFDQEEKLFHIQSKDMSYIFDIMDNGQPGHLYWGKKLNAFRKRKRPADDFRGILTALGQEYPAYGTLDYRYPAYQVQRDNGTTITELRYDSHQIIKGKEKLKGLPATYVEDDDEAETLKVRLLDPLAGLEVILSYTVYSDYPVITRSALFKNTGDRYLYILRALSTCVDFPDSDYYFLQLSGAWARERNLIKRPLLPGVVSIDSKRGNSSHEQNPFMALLKGNADEYQGEVYGFSLVYSGNFLAQAEVNRYNQTRVTMGINPFDFRWKLEKGEEFQTPEVVMVYSDSGLNKMSQVFHNIYRKRLARGKYRDLERPVLINNWEATYFDFNTEKILKLAREASELGIELFVLDDGWFGRRNDDTSSLGDWYVNKEKLPEGLKYIADEINKMGMKFGLWFEPEMISPDSRLYEKHPDWCIHVPGRKRSLLRNQLVLDLSRQEVCEYIIEQVSSILESANISYVKWDMNRQMSEIGSAALPADRQRETAHRYILGLYRILEEITSRFPDILFESCAGGGGRFDPGMLYYMPQTWTSDNTDAIERLKIQYGTSLVYPLISMGAHVSAVPNHQVGRITPLKTRADVAFFGNFGYELDLTSLSQEEKEEVKKQIQFYKSVRRLVLEGNFYRLLDPFTGNNTAWMLVSEDREEALAAYYQLLAEPNPGRYSIKLKGLDPDKKYRIVETDEVYGGDELMYAGLEIEINPFRNHDFRSFIWKLESV
ncbi:MAG: alpha-galactosidase [Halanaerobiaceae bacterium]|nr:alpha-galactosidase [Halanaerobiaceae bacterium]